MRASSFRWVAVGAAALAGVVATSTAQPGAWASTDEHRQAGLAAARQYTAALHDQARAAKAGWVDTGLPCFDNPGPGDNNGGMGAHWIRQDGSLADPPDATTPDILVFDPVTGDLGAVEYVVLQSAMPVAPSLFGHGFGAATLPDGTRVWELHAWIWTPNPNGMFKEYNPDVHLCP